MTIIDSPQQMQALCEEWRRAEYSIGFVPTMGALHDGHLALCRRAREENQKFVASIFVNPIQFRPGEDLNKYPRPFERDCELLQAVGCDALFAPSHQTMYPSQASTFVDVEKVSTRWEGESRPGHFRGVATVVAKLLNIVPAHRAYFGEKDFQQLKVIERMACDLNFNVVICPCETIREPDGLALSSRNIYLSPEDRTAAPVLYRALETGQDALREGERNVESLLHVMREVLQREPRILTEYLAVVDNDSFEPMDIIQIKPARAIIAARAGSTRLIDNIALNA